MTQTQTAECYFALIPRVVLAMTSSLSGYTTSKFGALTIEFIAYFSYRVRKNKPGVRRYSTTVMIQPTLKAKSILPLLIFIVRGP